MTAMDDGSDFELLRRDDRFVFFVGGLEPHFSPFLRKYLMVVSPSTSAITIWPGFGCFAALD
jgi:hypothetical protein